MSIRSSWVEATTGLSLLVAAGLLASKLLPVAARADTEPVAPASSSAPSPSAELLPSRPAGAPKIASYTLEARLDADKHVVDGRGTIVWTNPARLPAHELYLHLYLNAFKNEKSLFLRSPFGAGRSGSRAHAFGYIDIKRLHARELDAELWPASTATTPGDPDDQTSVRVDLPSEVGPGQTLTLEVEFSSQLPEIVERTGYSGPYHFVAQWFPKLAKREPDGTWADFPFHAQSEFYADYCDYDVTLDVPEAMVVGATGSLASQRQEHGRRSERWIARGVHDFAFTAWPGFREARERIGGVDVRLLYPPGHERNREVTLQALRFALPFFSKQYGAYPYPTLTVVHPPRGGDNSGGMEYPTLITTGGPWYTSYSGVRGIESVTVHELGHQWFYGLVASNEHAYPFLDEGINTYAENFALATHYGAGSLVDAFGLVIDARALSRTFAAAREQDAAVALAAQDFPSFRTMAALVYSRTGAALETLARVYGRDSVTRALADYTSRFRFGNPVPSDLLESMRREVGKEAASALRTALLERGTVDFLVRDVQSAPETQAAGVFERDGRRETLVAEPAGHDANWLGRAVVYRHGSVELPVDVEFIDEHGERTRQRWDGHGSFRVFDWRGRARLTTVVVDPDLRVLLDGNLLNNADSSRKSSAHRVFERGTYAFQVMLSCLLP